jgi:glycosyltransferase involved in cell wall biosynthesis
MTCKLRVTCVLPRTGEWPSGGLRVTYEHANHLARRGHTVSVVHPVWLVANPGGLDHVKNSVRYVFRKLDGRFTPEKWFRTDPNVRLLCVPSLSERFLPDGDVVIATAWQTAEWVSRYSRAKGRGFYFIQHLETWNGPEERVYATWKTPLQKVVISKWLAEVARDLGESAIYIPNGLDVDRFPMLIPSEDRRDNQLMMLYHKAEWKGSEDGLDALRLVREKEPSVRVSLFGTPTRPKGLPDWMDYHRLPSPDLLRELYNQAAIFVAPSRTEGWGLPACEAMLSGAALVATDIDGHREFAFHGQTALTSPSRSPRALAGNILRLIKDPALRIELAQSGSHFVRQFTWARASSSLQAALCERAAILDEG